MGIRRNSFTRLILLLGLAALYGERLSTRLDPTDDGVATNHVATHLAARTSAQGQCITEDKWGRTYVGTGRRVDSFFSRTGDVLRYQYHLEGTGAAWSRPTEERHVKSGNLLSGTNRSLVGTVTTAGVVSAKPASLAFTIAPRLYERWWLRALLLTLVAAIIYALHRYRLMQLLEMERLRTRIATDLHDDIGSTLSQIAILSEMASRGIRKQEQLELLSEIAHLSRESVDSMSEIVWAIDPGQDRLEDLCHRMRRFANDLFTSNGTHVQFRAPEGEQNLELGAEMRRQIFLIFKETLHNAARHSGCTEVEIDLGVQKGLLELMLRDNGKGFDAENVQKGHGLLSIEQRAKELRGHIIVDSAPGRGTSIYISMPLGHRFIGFNRRSYTQR